MRFEDNEYYHVYNRGAHKGLIFSSDENYRYFLSLLQKYIGQYHVKVVAYCLMPNHYHFVFKQEIGGSISRFLQTLFNSYVQAVNLEQHHAGTLFEGRPKAKLIDSDEYALQVIRYIHLNPVEAAIVSNPGTWEFSDYPVWCGLRESSVTDLSLRNTYFNNASTYEAFVKAYQPSEPFEGQDSIMGNLRKVAGTLFIVATPIGNLEDISSRAIKVLASVDLIAAEDTRKTKILLDHYQISKPMLSYFSYNEKARTPQLIGKLLGGQSIALVSDAGTPGISDPAYQIVTQAIADGIPIVPIPGASAFLSALIASGLDTRSFVFEGFLPQKKGRKTKLELLRTETRTVILYESPHRVLKTLNEILSLWGERNVVVCRELTKKFEEIVRGPVSVVLKALSAKPTRGEYVILVQGASS